MLISRVCACFPSEICYPTIQTIFIIQRCDVDKSLFLDLFDVYLFLLRKTKIFPRLNFEEKSKNELLLKKLGGNNLKREVINTIDAN